MSSVPSKGTPSGRPVAAEDRKSNTAPSSVRTLSHKPGGNVRSVSYKGPSTGEHCTGANGSGKNNI